MPPKSKAKPNAPAAKKKSTVVKKKSSNMRASKVPSTTNVNRGNQRMERSVMMSSADVSSPQEPTLNTKRKSSPAPTPSPEYAPMNGPSVMQTVTETKKSNFMPTPQQPPPPPPQQQQSPPPPPQPQPPQQIQQQQQQQQRPPPPPAYPPAAYPPPAQPQQQQQQQQQAPQQQFGIPPPVQQAAPAPPQPPPPPPPPQQQLPQVPIQQQQVPMYTMKMAVGPQFQFQPAQPAPVQQQQQQQPAPPLQQQQHIQATPQQPMQQQQQQQPPQYPPPIQQQQQQFQQQYPPPQQQQQQMQFQQQQQQQPHQIQQQNAYPNQPIQQQQQQVPQQQQPPAPVPDYGQGPQNPPPPQPQQQQPPAPQPPPPPQQAHPQQPQQVNKAQAAQGGFLNNIRNLFGRGATPPPPAGAAPPRPGGNVPEAIEQSAGLVDNEDHPGMPEDNASEKRRRNEMVTNWVKRTLEHGIEGLKKEYRDCPNDAPIEKCQTFKENPTKNRYHNIPCNEATRVRLPDDPVFYIHGNFVSSGTIRQRYLCTQAPLNSTIEDFWKMILNNSVEYIVMLCEIVEKGKVKSAEYFPSKIGDITNVGTFCTVMKESSVDLDKNVAMSTFRVHKSGEEFSSIIIKHVHWHLWPDHGAPDNYLTPFRVIAAIRQSKKPIAVHCSAGVGRTGTLVLISLILEGLRSPEFCGVPKLLSKLREERFKAVQTEIQYLYVHRCMIEYLIQKKYATCKQKDYAKFKEEYEQTAEKVVDKPDK